jgi:hypothetical protein
MSSFTMSTESDSPIAGFKLYRKSLAGLLVHTIQQLNEYLNQSGASALNMGSSS